MCAIIRYSIGSRQIAIQCIENAFAIVKSHEIPMTPFEKEEIEAYKRIYRELGGVLDDTSLESQGLMRKSSLKSEASQKYRSSFRSSMFIFKDEDEVYRNVDALISEAIAIRDLAYRQMDGTKDHEAAENLCRATRYFRMLLSKLPENNSRYDELQEHIDDIIHKRQSLSGGFGGHVQEHVEGEMSFLDH